MQDFDYVTPASLSEAVGILGKHRGKARCLAGGTDLIDQLRSERRTPSLVVDVKAIPELNRLSFSRRAGLRIGAAVPCSTIYQDPTVQELYPVLVEATSLVGDVKIQNRAGIGGNLCNAAPSADTAPAVMALGGVCVVAGPKGSREIPAERFFTGPGRTAMTPDELLVEIAIPPPRPNSAGNYLRLIPRNEMDIAVVGVASRVTVGRAGSNVVKEARIALAAVAPTPVRAARAEVFLEGGPLTADTIREASALAARSARPISDMRSSREYRLEIVKTLVQRTLTRCAVTLGIGIQEEA